MYFKAERRISKLLYDKGAFHIKRKTILRNATFVTRIEQQIG